MRIVTCLLLTSVLAGCFNGKSVEEHINAAKNNIEKQQLNDAIIELKNAISQAPENEKARYLLGKVYFDLGLFASACKELERAYDVNAKSDETALILAKCYYYSESHQQSIDLLTSLTASGNKNSEIYYYLYLNQVIFGKDSEAAQSLSLGSTYTEQPYQILFELHQLVKQQKIENAFNKSKSNYEQFSNNIEFLKFHAHLANLNRTPQEAAKSYGHLVKQLPEYLLAKILYADALVRSESFDKANTEINQLLKLYPKQGYINFLKATVLFHNENLEGAKKHAEISIHQGISNNQARLIAAIANYKLKKLEQSYDHFLVLKNQMTLTSDMKRIVTELQLRLGYPADANSTINELTDLNQSDFELLLQTGMQNAKQGDMGSAQTIAKKMKQLKLDDVTSMAKLGAFEFAINQSTESLEKALDMSSDEPKVKASLAQAYLAKAEYDSALQLAEKWLAENPKDPMALNLAALSSIKLEKTNTAEKYLNTIAEQNENSPVYLNYYAFKAIEQNNYQAAKAHLTKLIANNPDYAQGFNNYFLGYKMMGEEEQALSFLQKEYQKHNMDHPAFLAYVKALMVENKNKKVINLLQNSTLNSNSPDLYWYALGASLVKTKQLDKSLNTFKEWAASKPSEAMPWIAQISILERQGDFEKALHVTQQASSKFANDNNFKLQEIYFLLKTNNATRAVSKIEQLRAQAGLLDSLIWLESQAALLNNSYDKALVLSQAYYERNSNSTAARTVYTAFNKLNRTEEAYSFLQTHIKSNPNDFIILRLLASLAAQKDVDYSINLYQKIVDKSPSDVTALNNLAWLLAEQKQLKKALEIAKKANQIDKENPQVLDTLAVIYLKLEQPQDAFKTARRAFLLADSNVNIAMTYLNSANGMSKQKIDTVLKDFSGKAVSNNQRIQTLLDKLKSNS